MKSYHNDPIVKDRFVNRMLANIQASNLVRGATSENGKGCAIYCTLNEYNLKNYETQLGVPEWLAIVEDRLFNNVGYMYSRYFPLNLLRAIPIGLSEIDFNKIKAKFLIFVLKENTRIIKDLNIPGDLKKKVIKAISQCLAVQEKAALTGEVDEGERAEAYSVAHSATELTSKASLESPKTGAWPASEFAKTATWSAKWSVMSEENSVASSVGSAAWSVSNSEVDSANEKFADKLIELLIAAGVKNYEYEKNSDE